MNHLGTVKIETPRLVLRRFVPEDAEAMYRNWAGDDEVTRFLTWPTHADAGVSRAVLDNWCAQYVKPDFYQWAIVIRENGSEPVGSISVVKIIDRAECVEIGYCIGREWWGRGLMTEALTALIDFFFGKAEVLRVQSYHDPVNAGSGRVMQKSGMTYEGTLRRADRNNTGVCDAAYYGILREEWKKA